jgi:predicted nucleic acid-binding Zn ribbon protein
VSDDDHLDLARQIAKSYRGKGAPGFPSGPGPKKRTRPVRPARGKNEDPSTIGDLLGEVVKNQGWTEKLDDQRIFTDWARILGAEVAQHAEIEGFEDAIVHVRASSTAWATQLKLLAPRIVAKLNDALGDGTVTRIEVRGPQAPSWKNGPRSIRGARGPRDTYG